MPKQYEFFQGKAHHAKVQHPDLVYKNWNLKLYPTPESLDKFMKLKESKEETEGILNEVKMDDDGTSITLRRQMYKDFGRGVEPLSPPDVLDAEGRPLPKDVMIGNGSDVTAKVEVYTFKRPFKKGIFSKGKAIRLMAVRVDNLVPYTKESRDERKEKDLKGLDDQPPQLF